MIIIIIIIITIIVIIIKIQHQVGVLGQQFDCKKTDSWKW